MPASSAIQILLARFKDVQRYEFKPVFQQTLEDMEPLEVLREMRDDDTVDLLCMFVQKR